MASAAEVVTKVCTKCGETKPLTEFYTRKTGSLHRVSECKVCCRARSSAFAKSNPDKQYARHVAWQKANPEKKRLIDRRSALKYKYGITDEQYEAMLQAQGGVCKICLKPCKTGKRLAVDHVKDSDPPIVRGLLCVGHNTGIGHFNHDVELLESAIRYLNDTAH